jgi:hypothetical protein
MEIIEILKNPILKLPKDIKAPKQTSKFLSDDDGHKNKIADPELVVFITETLEKYKTIIDTIEDDFFDDLPTDSKKIIHELCDKLIKVIKLYYQGMIGKAYAEFENAVDGLNYPIKCTRETLFKSDLLFRAREGDNKQYSLTEMFHLPFEKRNYASSQRFSMPGFPCLYLSNSAYVCWEETNRPQIDKMQVSRFEIKKDFFQVLDISLTSSLLVELIENGNRSEKDKTSEIHKKIENYFMLWPISMVCAIKVNDIKADYKPEYIFPQFLLQWVIANKKVNGIKYQSIDANNHLDNNFPNIIGYTSFVIPVREAIRRDGQCDFLKENFALTEPISWELINICNPNLVHKEEQKNEFLKRKMPSTLLLKLVKGKPSIYSNTIFGKLEIELMRTNAISIQ